MGYNGIAPIFFKGLSNVTAVPDVQLGTRRLENGEEYVYCYNNTGSSATQGCLMIASGGVSGFSFTRSSTAAIDIPMVGVKHVTVPAGEYFWGLVRGTMYILSATISAGNPIAIGADGVCQSHLAATFATGTAIGKMLAAGSGATNSLAYVRLFG